METTRYESLLLTVPEITNDESAEIEKLLDKKIQSHKGKLLSFDRWGKYLLAYPIKRNEYGVYYLARFDIPAEKKEDVLKEIKALLELKLGELVMRHIISHLDSSAPLDYKRPQSLDETPKDVDQFLKENKMSGIAPRRDRENTSRERDTIKKVEEKVETVVEEKE